jgi:hypothetical protein
VRKWEASFLLKVEGVGRSWKHSKAPEPGEAVGMTLLVNLRWEKHGEKWRPAPRQVAWLREAVGVGDRVRCDLNNDEGQRLHLMELDQEQRRHAAGAEGPRHRLPKPELPAGFRGFSGTLAGFCVMRKEHELLFLVAKVVNTWKNNHAERPQEIVWRAVHIDARRGEDGEPAARHVRWISTLVPGEDYRLEVKDGEHGPFILELNERQRKAADAAKRR